MRQTFAAHGRFEVASFCREQPLNIAPDDAAQNTDIDGAIILFRA
jgi:hypothetical protein